MNKTTTTDMCVDRGKPTRPAQGPTGNQGAVRVGEMVFLREEHTDWLSSPESICTNNIIQTEQFICRNMCIQIHIACNNNLEKR